jgi:hypothetical protein
MASPESRPNSERAPGQFRHAHGSNLRGKVSNHREHAMITELFWTEGHSFAPGHEPSILDWVRYFINENTELLISIGSGFVSFYITLFCLRRIVAVVKRALRDPHAEEEAAQEALRKLAEAEARREPRVRRRAAPGAVHAEIYDDGEGWDGMEAARPGGTPGHSPSRPTHGADGYVANGHGSERYGADRFGGTAHAAAARGPAEYGSATHGSATHGSATHGAPVHAYAAGSGHAPRPGSFFAHRGERSAR